jgi:hypothetical protein
MSENMRKVIDVTITYPEGAQGPWKFMCSKKSRIIVRIELLPLDKSLHGQDPDDPAYKKRLNAWLNTIWRKKDIKIARQIKRNKAATSTF